MTTSQGPHGPFDTEAQVLAHPDVQAVFEAAHASNRRGVLREGAEAILLAACTDTGAEPGEYGARMIRWLADFGPQACAVFADLIRQAAHGKPGPNSIVFDLADGNNTHFVLTESLEQFSVDQRSRAKGEGGNPSRDVWADRADEMHEQTEAAMKENQ